LPSEDILDELCLLHISQISLSGVPISRIPTS
jgi:hypothetical protein